MTSTVDPDVQRNDWSAVVVPPIGDWQPELTVSVVVPAYHCQASLDLTLAGLARQTYPESLTEVIVVDDGSDPPLRLPEICPKNCRLVRASGERWGIASAIRLGVRQSTGEIIHRIDADMVLAPDHVEAHARWHHKLTYAVTLGSKSFVRIRPGDAHWPSPRQVFQTEPLGRLFTEVDSAPHEYIEQMLRRTRDLCDGDHLTFLAHAGATVAVRRELYEAAGGVDTRLRLGEDTEFGYRLAQAGAVFIPESAARSWHLGPTQMMRDAERTRRYSRPFLADVMPHPRWLRTVGGTSWAVPLVTVVLHVADHPFERVRAAVDALLDSDEPDLRGYLVGPWSLLAEEERAVLSDAHLDLRLVAATYRSEPKIQFVEKVPDPFPSPYLVTVPATVGLAKPALRRLVDEADRHQVGLVRTVGKGLGTEPGQALELWRTSALGRAEWVRRPDEPLVDVVTRTHGERTLAAHQVGVVDLVGVSPEQLAKGRAAVVAGVRPGNWSPRIVEVGGARSLATAAAVVSKAGVAQAGRKLRHPAGDVVSRAVLLTKLLVKRLTGGKRHR